VDSQLLKVHECPNPSQTTKKVTKRSFGGMLADTLARMMMAEILVHQTGTSTAATFRSFGGMLADTLARTMLG